VALHRFASQREVIRANLRSKGSAELFEQILIHEMIPLLASSSAMALRA
jgi:hypothetical protein